MAGILPGLLLTTMFVLAIWILVTLKPALAPTSTDRDTFEHRIRLLGRAGWIIGIILVTIGGIYAGVFSAIEAAGIGAILAFAVTFFRKALSWENIKEVTTSTLKSTGTVFLILFGAFVFKTFVGFTGLPLKITDWIEVQGFTGMQVVVAILVIFMILGTFLEGFAILVLAVPLVQPILESLGVDMIWFGVLMVIVLEMALISPPVGINVFVVKGIAEGVPLNTIFRGIWPFWIAMAVVVVFILMFPNIALLLPNTMFG